MKRAKQKKIKPRNLVAQSPLLRKGGAHQREDKRANRSRLRARLRSQLREEQS